MITINDVVYKHNSIGINNVQCFNDKVIINGVDVTPDSKIVNINIIGDVSGNVRTGTGDISHKI